AADVRLPRADPGESRRLHLDEPARSALARRLHPETALHRDQREDEERIVARSIGLEHHGFAELLPHLRRQSGSDTGQERIELRLYFEAVLAKLASDVREEPLCAFRRQRTLLERLAKPGDQFLRLLLDRRSGEDGPAPRLLNSGPQVGHGAPGVGTEARMARTPRRLAAACCGPQVPVSTRV